ncbi:MAG: hypothetical protein ABSC23_13720 [Bryobacteraceae bacterium]|jgi:hypothetical protein
MPILKPEGFKLSGLAIRTQSDGYAPDGCQGGLVYFTMDGKKMVLLVKERRIFDSKERKTFQEYANVHTTREEEAAGALEKLILQTQRR